jgi:hypothetical protein
MFLFFSYSKVKSYRCIGSFGVPILFACGLSLCYVIYPVYPHLVILMVSVISAVVFMVSVISAVEFTWLLSVSCSYIYFFSVLLTFLFVLFFVIMATHYWSVVCCWLYSIYCWMTGAAIYHSWVCKMTYIFLRFINVYTLQWRSVYFSKVLVKSRETGILKILEIK